MKSLSQQIIFSLLKRIKYGTLIIHDKNGKYIFSGSDEAEPTVQIRFHNTDIYRKILVSGSLAAGETYMHGDWDVDHLSVLIEIFIKNQEIMAKMDGRLAKVFNFFLQFVNLFKVNTIARSKKNILAHYDLGNDFFIKFLDPGLMYSSALFEPNNISLAEASVLKVDKICQLLQLTSTDHLLEIGSGWGGFAIHAATKYGCHVTTTTISDKQYSFVKEKIHSLGLEKNITLLNQDYRQLKGKFDKLVSIEMIEAIGYQHFNGYFKKCDALLKSGGLFLLQAILINDQEYARAKTEVDFIRKYIFPGGCLPSMQTISTSVANHTKFQLLHLQDIGLHYAKTLKAWHDNFNARIDEIKAQGFSEKFIRMWRYYLSYCEGAFRQQYITDIHALWQKRI